MLTLSINFSKMQAEEIAHKLTIVRDEDDLLESYGLDHTLVDFVTETFLRSKGGIVEFDALLADCLVEELDNACDIALSNMGCADDQGQAELRGYISSMRAAQRKVRKAQP